MHVRAPLVSALAVVALAGALSACAMGARIDEKPAPAGTASDDLCPVDFSTPVTQHDQVYEDDPVIAPRKKEWENARGGEKAARVHIRARMRGWPTRVLGDAASLPRGGRPLLEQIARDTWKGLDALTDRENGLPIDHLSLSGPKADLSDPDQARLGDYANVTTVGLHLIALVGARELGLISAADARARAAQILATLERLETHDGYLFNYYDTTSLERTSNFLSFVDLSWLAAGLIVTRGAFPDLAPAASGLLDRIDLGLFYDAERGQMTHGYYVHRRARSRYHYGVLYTEARLGLLLAIGKGDAPREVWQTLVRVFPPACLGQSLEPRGLTREQVAGHDVWRGYYEWDGFRYVPSWGGSMFEALMPLLVLDELRYAPRSLGQNDRVHAAVQERFARRDLGYPVWGMSPSTQPGSDLYGEYGARVLGMRGYLAGAVTPHATALAVAVRPAQATAALATLAQRYPIYGEYGFYDAVDPKSGTVAYRYLTLDQSMLFIALANHLSGGKIRKIFAADEIVQPILPLLAAETFFD